MPLAELDWAVYQPLLADHIKEAGARLSVLYHANCHDGLGAAWAVRGVNSIGTFTPVQYPAEGGSWLPDMALIRDRFVVVVDFCYPNDLLDQMTALGALGVWVIDHHVTAALHLERWLGEPLVDKGAVSVDGGTRGYVYDLGHSGAVLTWMALAVPVLGPHPPGVLQYIQDRDLWRFELLESRSVQAWLAYILGDASDAEALEWGISQANAVLSSHKGFAGAVATGGALLAYREQIIRQIMALTEVKVSVLDHLVPGCVMPPMFASDAGHMMLGQGALFSVTWWDTPSGLRKYSLRSGPTGLDVSAIAQRYGGGGHRHAAGFAQYIRTGHVLSSPAELAVDQA